MLREDSRETLVEYFKDRGIEYRRPIPFSELGYYTYDSRTVKIQKKGQCLFWRENVLRTTYRFPIPAGVIVVMYNGIELQRIHLFTTGQDGKINMELIYRK